MTMNAYDVTDDNGTDWIVISDSVENAAIMIREADDDAAEPIEANRVSCEMANRVKIHGDGDGEIHLLSYYVRTAEKPYVLSCSEW